MTLLKSILSSLLTYFFLFIFISFQHSYTWLTKLRSCKEIFFGVIRRHICWDGIRCVCLLPMALEEGGSF